MLTNDQQIQSATPRSDRYFAEIAPVVEKWFSARPNQKEISILVTPKEGSCKYILASDRRGREYVISLPKTQANFHAGIASWAEKLLLKTLKVSGGGYLTFAEEGILRIEGSSSKYGPANHRRAAEIVGKCYSSLNLVIEVDGQTLKRPSSVFEDYDLPIFTEAEQTIKSNNIDLKNDLISRGLIRISSFFGEARHSPDLEMIERKELIRIGRDRSLINLPREELLEALETKLLLLQRKWDKAAILDEKITDAELEGFSLFAYEYKFKAIFRESYRKLEGKIDAYNTLIYTIENNPSAEVPVAISKCIAHLDLDIRSEASCILENLWHKLGARKDA